MTDNTLYTLWLMNEINPSRKLMYKMLRIFDSPKEAYSATSGHKLGAQYFEEDERDAFANHDLRKAEEMIKYCDRRRIKIISFYDKEYPYLLKQIPTPPPALFVKGELPEMSASPSVTVIGTRDCSKNGRHTAAKIAYDLSLCGITVVSGMARGIDTYAHKGCLLAGKAPTVAVLAGNVEEIYPKENKELYYMIAQHGAVVSENLPCSPTVKWGFHQRNRILSGMTHITLVVESGIKGGSMITVRHALDQNRTVFAVPGEPDSKQSEGTNSLIKNGAAVCTDASDIINELRYIFKEAVGHNKLLQIKNDHREEMLRRKKDVRTK